ncbi:MAG: hypothetical protein U5Q16_05430 [Gammaproteobacteria bacterium]|nr:hypothetical protein [Gammaproteobacteria bacterium]
MTGPGDHATRKIRIGTGLMGARLFPVILLALVITTGSGGSVAASSTADRFDEFQPSRESPWLRFHAEFVHSNSATPPQDVDWAPVTLPDTWRSEARWKSGISGWYRFRLPDEPPDDAPAVYLYRFSMNAAVYLNDEFIGSGGSFEEPHRQKLEPAPAVQPAPLRLAGP